MSKTATKAPAKTCQDFAITHQRWAQPGIGTPHERRMTEYVKYCPHHYGIAFPGYHIATINEDRVFECSYCGCTFTEKQAAEPDTR